jgi:hypothetical protein
MLLEIGAFLMNFKRTHTIPGGGEVLSAECSVGGGPGLGPRVRKDDRGGVVAHRQ